MVSPQSTNRVFPRARRKNANASTSAEHFDQELAGSCFAGARISIYTSFEECECLWREAFERCPGFAFQAFEWLSTWHATVGRIEGVLPYIVHVAGAETRTLLILPLGIYPRRTLRILGFLGGGVTDYNAPIVDCDLASRISRTDFSRLWAIILDRLPKVDVVWLSRMPETIDGDPNPALGLHGAAHTRNAYGAHLPASFAAFKAKRSGRLFNDSRRQRKRLAEIGPLTISTATTAEEAISTLHVMARQKSRRWLSTGGSDLFALPGYLLFYEQLTGRPFQTGTVHVSYLRVGDEIIATHWGLLMNGRFYYLMPGYEAGEWGRFSPGRLLLESLIEWCIAQKDIHVFDLTVGEDSYKQQWADHSLRLYEYLAPRSVKGALFVGHRRLRERLKQNPHIRNLVRRVRARMKGQGWKAG